MVLAASTIRAIRADLVARLEPHQLDLVSSLIEAEVLQNATIKRALQSKVNDTLKSFGVQEAGGSKAAK